MDNFEYQLNCDNCGKITRHTHQALGETNQVQKAKSGFISGVKRFLNLCFGEPLEKAVFEKSEYICSTCGASFNESTDMPDFSGHDD
ncbi:hypothetical protein [Photobacterium angustum]|uniref:Uncharacterized protein n=1 Tax=Photobacterium angustum TaxID=661 RepID=A0A2S7VYA0_PHOAN|nr:hypothetical protein [Photobacterium angustum]PQJ66875.1 hypothetical protein BTO08_05275 [Photobacterium angustum]